MSVVIGPNATKVHSVTVADRSPIVKKIVLGRPVRRVIGSTSDLDGLSDVAITSPIDGHVLVYNGTSEIWENTLTLDKQDITGGQY